MSRGSGPLWTCALPASIDNSSPKNTQAEAIDSATTLQKPPFIDIISVSQAPFSTGLIDVPIPFKIQF